MHQTFEGRKLTSKRLLVIGIQYYHIAKIILALCEPPPASSTYESLRHSRIVEVRLNSVFYIYVEHAIEGAHTHDLEKCPPSPPHGIGTSTVQ